MAFRFRILLAALLVLVGLGCRKPLAPSTEFNAAPETWITAAPQDTITIRNNQGTVIGQPAVGVVAFRFHLYWAGSDHDGEVRGFYWAVTETVKTPGIDTEPPVPAPKPSDYRYTTKTDSTFIFNVIEETRTRRHAFYLYAVDNEGRVDPTPARFVFDALDRFPPLAVLTHAYADGPFRDPLVPGAPLEIRRFALTDTFENGRAPRDTVPAGSRLLFRWRGEEAITGNPAVAFKYKLYEPSYTPAEPGVDSVVYGPDRSGDGRQIFDIRALDVAGASRTDAPTTRFFVTNFSPDSWFAGPDPTVSGVYSTNWSGGSPAFNDGQRFRDVTSWANPFPTFPNGIPGSLLGRDSLLVMPKDRIPRKTFFEIYRNRIYVRSENDTVNMNSWVLFFAGGYDKDSPYNVRVDGFKFDTTSNPVVKRTGPNGSPIGFRLYVPVKIYPSGPLSPATISQVFPLDEALSVPEDHIAGYVGMRQTGRAYATMRAVDGNGRADDRLQNPAALADSVDANLYSPSHPRYKLRQSSILTFYVNRAPYLATWNSLFRPQGPWNIPAPNDTIVTYSTRDIPVAMALYSSDQDPFDPTQSGVGGPPSGPAPVQRFRYTYRIRGRTVAGTDTVYAPTLATLFRTDVAPSTINVPNFLQGPDVTLECDLCDYQTVDFNPGEGRCRFYQFPVRVPIANPNVAAAPLRARPNVKTGPGDPRSTDGGLE